MMGKGKKHKFTTDDQKRRRWIVIFFIAFVLFLIPISVVLVYRQPENTLLNTVLGVMYLMVWENLFRMIGARERWYRLPQIRLGDTLKTTDFYKIKKENIGKDKIFRRVDDEVMVLSSVYRGRWIAIAIVALCLLIYVIVSIRNGGGFAKDHGYVGAVGDMLIVTASLYIMLYDLLYPTMYITLNRKKSTITIPAPMPFCLFTKPKTIPFEDATMTFLMGNDNKYLFNGSLAIFHPSHKLHPIPTEFSGLEEGYSVIFLMQKYMNSHTLQDFC